jgi:hypothetical protein
MLFDTLIKAVWVSNKRIHEIFCDPHIKVKRPTVWETPFYIIILHVENSNALLLIVPLFTKFCSEWKTFLFTCIVYKNFSSHVGYWEIIWSNKFEFYLSKHKTLYNATNKTQHHYHHLSVNWQVTNLEYLSLQAQTCVKISSTPKHRLTFTLSLRTVSIFILKQSR